MDYQKHGDKGQRYEIRAKDGTGKESPLGWTNDPTGGGVLALAKNHPAMFEPRVVDRFPEIEKFIDVNKFKAGCRKCVEAVYASKEACPYCNMRFPLAEGRLA